MRRWIIRALPALVLSLTLPAMATAQPAAPPPAGPTQSGPTVVDLAPTTVAPGGPVVVAPNGPLYLDPYHAASPYNPGEGQPVPNPLYNRPVTTLPCGYPNQNLDPYASVKPGCNRCGCGKSGCGKTGCGYDGGACCDCNNRSCWQKLTHPYCGVCSKGGACTTCCNTHNFAFGSSQSFFGESSREFFERPPSPDGLKECAKVYCPAPAPAAYIPATVIVTGHQ